MKLLTVSGLLASAHIADPRVSVPAKPALWVNVETLTITRYVPADCPKEVGPTDESHMRSCYDNAQDFPDYYSFSGEVSAGAYTGVRCAFETADHSATYLVGESLVPYMAPWLRQGEATGTYILTLERSTGKECAVSFLVPSDQTGGIACTGPIDGIKVGEDVRLPEYATSVAVQAADFADSMQIVVVARGCTLQDFGTGLASIDATAVAHPFTFPEPDPNSASAHFLIGTLFVLPLVATV